MNRITRSLLLGAPAVLMGASVGYAADLPANRAAPVAYVRVCDAYGSGFFYIPGTDTCLRVGGYVRFEYRYQNGHDIVNPGAGLAGPVVSQIAGAQDESGMEIRGRIDVDARTQTQWGTVQTVVHLRGANADGIRAESGGGQFQTSFTPGGNKSTSLTMERAYIRFAGLTAGVSSENFSTMPAYMYGPNIYAGFPNGVKQLAYTATFGGGFSATIAAESLGDFASIGGGSSNAFANGGVPYAYGSVYNNLGYSGYALVGNVRYDSSFGYIQLAGAVQDDSVRASGLGYGSTGGTYSPLSGPSGQVGYAVGLSFRYNLPFIAAGDQFHFQAAYGHGAQGFVHSNGTLNDLSDSTGAYRWLGGVQTVPENLIATSAGGGAVTSVGLVDAEGVYGLFTHYWAPTWRSNFQAGYLHVQAPQAAASAGLQEGNANVFDTGANLIWSPAKSFDIGVELDYEHLSQNLQNRNLGGAGWVAAGYPGLKSSGLMGTLRLEREF